MITRIAIILGWISVIAVGAMLRFDHLSTRPLHFDEGTGARITAQRMDSADGYRFNPAHNHGPLLSSFSAAINRLRGERTWRDLTKGTLRLLPALAGSLVVLVPLFWRRRWGDGPMLAAAALLATSPLLVYNSRMFIHEILLVLFGMLALLTFFSKPRYGILGCLGILLGLMFATKETVAISGVAWTGAGLLLAIENRRFLTRARLLEAWKDYRGPILLTILAATVTACLFYTDGFRRPSGAWDAVRTFFVYETESGHDKPFAYYLRPLVIPNKAGVWWYETPVAVLAVLAWGSTFFMSAAQAKLRATIRFIAYAAACHFLIYSLISYKTPWLMCLPWAHVCLLAGFSLCLLPSWRVPWRVVLLVFLALALGSQIRQARRVTGRFASDVRNPYAYVPTSGDIESVERWMAELGGGLPEGALEPVGVVGTYYWPLPWYLREFDQIGYWPEANEAIDELPLVFALPESLEGVTARLESSHTSVPRSLRAEVPVVLFLRNDIWNHWMNTE